jgi:asparagine synthase (glutamine-hydrolysing)
LEHRGPDQKGFFVDKNVSFGHRRLSIIDLSDHGNQPMSNEDETLWIVFNGEIYNYKELRKQLESKGHKFSSKTDTEVLVHMYQEFGEKCLEKLNGCFAFAIFDSKKRSLFLARDRMGIKPLYYTTVAGKFYFSSEIKALLEVPEFKKKVNLQALNNYLSFFANPGKETMFQGIFKLEPGHFLTFKDGTLQKKKYWDLKMNPQQLRRSPEKYLHNLLSDSVQKRLMSDVPLGVYLSGGVDSGSVVSLMKPYSEKIKTFSVGFDTGDTKDSELHRARHLAEHFETEHQEVKVGFDSVKHLPSIIWHQDEPMGDPTSIPTFMLSQEAKKKVTVVLTGEGADEQFAGYEQEKFMMLQKRVLQKFPLWMRHAGSFPLSKIPAKSFNPLFGYMEALGEEGKKRAVDFTRSKTPSEALFNVISIFSEKEKEEATSGKLLRETLQHSTEKQIGQDFSFSWSNGLLNQLLLFENKVMLTENLLMKVDKNTMAHGIEARVPFLDHRVVEFAAKLPQAMKLNGWRDKYLLRKTMENQLPAGRAQQKKQRFFVPVDHWLQNELSSLSRDYLSKRIIKRQGFFDHNYVNKMFSSYKSSPLFYGRQIWTLLNFQMWHKMFIEGEKVETLAI